MESATIIFNSIMVLIGVGVINWSIWLFRMTRSIFYRPTVSHYTEKTSVIIPVYKEKWNILKKTVDSILRNNPDEVILVLDAEEKENMHMLKQTYKTHLIKPFFFDKPGKRPALAEGIRRAVYPIVVLVDSDTSWESKDFLKHLLMPFADKKVGGVGSRQKVFPMENWTHRIIDWALDLKYTDFIPSDSISGSILCLSGRTAAYRRNIVLPVLHKLEYDYFLGHKCMGGDDARLTTLVLAQGYQTKYQATCIAHTPFSRSFFTYIKQKVRWSRNSFRTYIKSLFSIWPWKQGRWYYIIAAYHTIVPGITILLGIFLLAYTLYEGIYWFAVLWVLWAFFSRLIKGYSHVRRSKDIAIFPLVVLYYYMLGFVKIFAFFTMTKESWAGSRGDYMIKKGSRVTHAKAVTD